MKINWFKIQPSFQLIKLLAQTIHYNTNEWFSCLSCILKIGFGKCKDCGNYTCNCEYCSRCYNLFCICNFKKDLYQWIQYNLSKEQVKKLILVLHNDFKFISTIGHINKLKLYL